MKKDEADKLYDHIYRSNDIDPYSISDKLKEIFEAYISTGETQKAENIKWEVMVCGLVTVYNRKQEGFNEEYFSPKAVWKDGTVYPDINVIPESALAYLKERINVAENLFLKARYSDYIWFKTNDYKYAQRAFDNFLDLAEYLFKGGEEVKSFSHFHRALEIALRLNDKERIVTFKTSAINLIKNSLSNNEPRYILELSDILLSNRKILSKTERGNLVRYLDAGYEEYVTLNPSNYQMQREYLILTERCYLIDNDPGNAKRYRKKIADSFETEAIEYEKQKAPPTKVASLLESAIENYRIAGTDKGKIDELFIKLKKVNEEVVKGMKEHEVKTTIPKKAIDKLYETFRGLKKNDIIEFLIAADLSVLGAPSYTKAIEYAEKNSKEFPLQHLVSMVVYDRYNNILYRPQTPEEKLEYNAVQNYLLKPYLLFSDLSLKVVLEILYQDKGATTGDIMEYILKNNPINERRAVLLEKAINHFAEGDYVTFLHLAVIQIEGILRDMLYNIGGNVTRSVREGRYREKLLNEILAEPKIEEILTEFDYSLIKYVLANIIGMNIRNELAHGLYYYPDFDYQKSALVLLIILRLCKYELVQSSKNDDI